MNTLTRIVLATGVIGISYIGSALAVENEVCSKNAVLCASGTIILIKTNDEIAKLCNFDKSIAVGIGAVACVRK